MEQQSVTEQRAAAARDLPGDYRASRLEAEIYEWWLAQGLFNATGDPAKRPFTIVMPPPNVTGVLHLGHALDNTIQDLLIRFRRMQGYDALWLPGMDHAGIATQTRVEAELRKREGLTRHDIGRDAFIERVWRWKEDYAAVIRQQLKRLGASCDFSRERFTMDEGLSQAVREVFVTLYERGLIYRGDYTIHWCPRCGTALSDIEVEHEETKGALYHVAYPFADGSGALTVATTRPETMFGDVAVAVHPDDERYQSLVGKMLRLPLTDREIPVIADAYVDPSFGTGAVKITPAHDANDFEVGIRHALPAINIMTKDAALNEHAGRFAGMDRFAARAEVARALEDLGVLKVTEHVHAVGMCGRCKTVVEPWLSTQWFVRMTPLAKPALEAVRCGDVRFVPDRFARIYEHWMENIRDWCISRQLWWGHRIPAWHCADCGAVTVARTAPGACGACGGDNLRQDEDVLDTWFSSALWPFSTMGWPGETEDLARYFPTDVLVTGFDIIPFWVSRMVFTSLAFTGQPPFRDVLIHGMVRDAQNRKFSKSLDNGIDPMQVIDEFSADALRFMLATSVALGQDMKFFHERVAAAQALVTKIWNAARFVLMNAGAVAESRAPEREGRGTAERYILHRLQETIQSVTDDIEQYNFVEAGRAIYEFFWNDFCDWYIELAKVALHRDGDSSREVAAQTLVFVLDRALRLLHPFMPFVTEALWRHLPHEERSIMVSAWPEAAADWHDPGAVSDMRAVMEVVRSVRNTRHEMNLAPGRRIDVWLKPAPSALAALQAGRAYLERLCLTAQLRIARDLESPENRVASVLEVAEVYIPLAGLVDLDTERARLMKELTELDFEVDRLEVKLKNGEFVSKAPARVVDGERAKLLAYAERREKVRLELGRLL